MVILFLVSAAVSIFIVAAMLILMVSGNEAVDARLMEIAARRQPAGGRMLTETSKPGLAGVAGMVNRALKPIRDLISGTDQDLAYRVALAGFRKPEHVEMFTAAKMICPVLGIAAGTFLSNMVMAILVGTMDWFFGPD